MDASVHFSTFSHYSHFIGNSVMSKYIEIDGRLVEIKKKTIEINGRIVDAPGEINIYVRQLNHKMQVESDSRRMTKLKQWLAEQAKTKIKTFYKIE